MANARSFGMDDPLPPSGPSGGASTSAPPAPLVTAPSGTPDAHEIALPQLSVLGIFIGVAGLLLGGLFIRIALTSDDPSDDLLDVGAWFSWLGSSLLAVSLLLGGLMAREARGGFRVAMVLVGVYVLMASQGTGLLSWFGGFL